MFGYIYEFTSDITDGIIDFVKIFEEINPISILFNVLEDFNLECEFKWFKIQIFLQIYLIYN